MTDQKITRQTTIEDLVGILPDSVRYLSEQGIRCIRCGEPIWETIESAARQKGHDDAAIDRFVAELNGMYHRVAKTD